MGIARRGVIGGVSALTGAFLLAKIPADASEAPGEASEVLADPGRVYLGSYTDSGGPGIVAAIADAATGALTLGTALRTVANPTWLELGPGGRTLYAISETTAGAVHALSLANEAAPATAGSVPTGNGPAHVAVHPSGSHLLTSLYGGGAVVVHPIAADGSVGAATTTRSHTADGAAHAHQVVFDPTGGFALSVDLGTDSVYVESFDPATGTLGAPVRVRSVAGAGPRHLAFHPDGGFAYVANEVNSTVTIYRWQGGVLTPGTSLSSRPSGASGQNFPSEILVSADGRFVYLANRGDNTVAVFAVGGGGATLQLVATPSCGGDFPRHMAFAPGGAFLYVANQRTGNVAWLPVDAQTGVPGAVAGSVSVPGAANIRFA
jgi:6-phosphogluconolactonase